MLYFLILTDRELCYDDYSEDFSIGFFESENQAEEIAKYYLKNVAGFCEFSCTYRIVPKYVSGKLISNKIWLVQGWDINDNLDEINIIESQCCVSKEQAELELETMKHQYQRSEWVVNCWTIGDEAWQEGFCRM